MSLSATTLDLPHEWKVKSFPVAGVAMWVSPQGRDLPGRIALDHVAGSGRPLDEQWSG
jgi:hypothetical protein